MNINVQDFFTPFLAASFGVFTSIFLLKIKKKWSDRYKAFNNPMIQIENLKKRLTYKAYGTPKQLVLIFQPIKNPLSIFHTTSFCLQNIHL